jgi:hypothetical protein
LAIGKPLYKFLIQKISFDLFVTLLVERADFDAYEAAVVIVEIWETLLIINVSDTTALMADRFFKNCICRAIFDT